MGKGTVGMEEDSWLSARKSDWIILTMFQGLLSSALHRDGCIKQRVSLFFGYEKYNHQRIRKDVFWPRCLLPIDEPDQRAAW